MWQGARHNRENCVVSSSNSDTLVLDSGVFVSSLTPLLPRLRLPWDYAVLAAILSPANGERSAYVLLNTCREDDPQPYVVYRVDRSDGSCHGGRYCGDYPRALQIFAEMVCGIETAYWGSRESKAYDSGYAAGLEAGRRLLYPSDQLTAPDQLRRECWVSRGQISGNLEEQAHLPLDTVEWQFSDGPAGERGYSEDFLSLEDGLRAMSGAVVHWDPDNDRVPDGLRPDFLYEEPERAGDRAYRGVVYAAGPEDTAELLRTTDLLYENENAAVRAANDLAWLMSREEKS